MCFNVIAENKFNANETFILNNERVDAQFDLKVDTKQFIVESENCF